MSFSSYNPHNRYRRRAQQRVTSFFKLFVFMSIFIAIGFFVGKEYTKSNDHILTGQLQAVTMERDDLRTEVTNLRAEVQTANTRFENMEATYRETVPDGPVEKLVNLVHQQIDEGMEPEKLEQIISSAQSPRECSEPETKRFVISTPAYTGPAGEVSIDEGVVVVKGSGFSAVNGEDKEEAWYNPAKPVTVTFTRPEGVEEKKEGVLPLHHAIETESYEYRIKIEEGARSFVKVTYDRCEKKIGKKSKAP